MIEYRDVMWDVVADGVTLGYVEYRSGCYYATALDGLGSEAFRSLYDAGTWLHQKAVGTTQVTAPRRAGDRKGDIV